MGDARQFKLDLERFGGNLTKIVGQLQRRGVFIVFGDLVKGSPVDTGRFRASWVIGIGSKSEDVAPEGTRGSKSAAGAESMTRLAAVTPATVHGTEPVIISNNLPYATSLADGHSGQAPSGWVEAAVARAQRELDVYKVKEGER